jgi:hypothetical protein
MCPIWAVDTYPVGSLPSSKSLYKYGPIETEGWVFLGCNLLIVW